MGYIVYGKSGKKTKYPYVAGKYKSPLAVGTKVEAEKIKGILKKKAKGTKWKIKIRKL